MPAAADEAMSRLSRFTLPLRVSLVAGALALVGAGLLVQGVLQDRAQRQLGYLL